MENRTAAQMAKLYGLKSSIAFNKLLVRCGLLEHNDKGYVLAEHLRGNGLTIVINSPFFLPSGIKAFKKRSVWTDAGQTFVYKTLSRIGIRPISELSDLFNNSAS